jgi:hypothetical protein
MAIIIDAYNVLHCTHVLPSRHAMMGLGEMCRLLTESRWRDGPMIVACDGTPGHPPLEPPPEVQLVYSGPNSDADTLIEQHIAQTSAPRHLTVVSNDRRLHRAARRRKARVMPAEQFLWLLVSPPTQTTTQPQPDPQPDDTESWMAEFGLNEDDAELALDTPLPTDLADRLEPDDQPSTEAPGPADPPNEPDEEDAIDRRLADELKPTDGVDFWLKEFGFDPQDDQQ